MSALARQLEADRIARDTAKAVFDARYGALKADFEARGLAGRILDEAIEQAAGCTMAFAVVRPRT